MVSESPGLERFFPPALVDADEAGQFRRRAVVGQARKRVEAARKVLEGLGDGERLEVQDRYGRTRTLEARTVPLEARSDWSAVALMGVGARRAQGTVARRADWNHRSFGGAHRGGHRQGS